ncbi:MAG: hypothetical protein EXR35_04970 [Limnohabitans sp.]|nr:hypothetical protein [Limnohabitans sp.]
MLPRNINNQSSIELKDDSIGEFYQEAVIEEARTQPPTLPHTLSFCQKLLARPTFCTSAICCYASAAAGLLLSAGVITYTILMHTTENK